MGKAQKDEGKSSKEKKKKPKRSNTLKITVGKQYIKERGYDIPPSLEVWTMENPPSDEYIEMMEELITVMSYASNRINEGPETKESLTKRTIALKGLITKLLFGTFLNGYHRLGLLLELLSDMYMDTGGTRKVLMVLSDIELAKKFAKLEEARKHSGAYTA